MRHPPLLTSGTAISSRHSACGTVVSSQPPLLTSGTAISSWHSACGVLPTCGTVVSSPPAASSQQVALRYHPGIQHAVSALPATSSPPDKRHRHIIPAFGMWHPPDVWNCCVLPTRGILPTSGTAISSRHSACGTLLTCRTIVLPAVVSSPPAASSQQVALRYHPSIQHAASSRHAELLCPPSPRRPPLPTSGTAISSRYSACRGHNRSACRGIPHAECRDDVTVLRIRRGGCRVLGGA
jgi:hypothetical protein